jgi:hypothetical protein
VKALQCCKCRAAWRASAVGASCPKCGSDYVQWTDYAQWFAALPAGAPCRIAGTNPGRIPWVPAPPPPVDEYL